MRDEKRCLLIWPPFLTACDLPLGIPSLTAYLKNNGIDNMEVIDLNMAYLRKKRFFFFLYILKGWYQDFAENISFNFKKTPPNIPRKDRPFWKKIIIYFYEFVNKKMSKALYNIENRKKRSMPWSLMSIINFDFGSTYIVDSKRIYHILNLLIKNNFSLIGISVIYPEQLFFAFMIAKIIKEKFSKDIYVILGGAQVTKHIDWIIKSEKIYDLVDFFITDDGEEPLAKLLEGLQKKRFLDIPNLYFKNLDRIKGYKKTERAFRLHPKDFLAPDFTGFNLNVYRDWIPLLASKGCFWSKCNFCSYAVMQEHKFCISTAEKILEIITKIKGIYGASKYHFVDDALLPKFMDELAKGLLKDKLNIKWWGNIALSRQFANCDFCKMLKSSGLTSVSIGLESASSHILTLMNKYHKDINDSETKEILTAFKNAGISVGIYIMFGFPTETIDEARQTLNFLIENRNLYNDVWIQPFCLEDNTPVFNNPEKFGITKIYKEDKSSGERLGYRYEVAKGMSQEEARKFTYKEAVMALKTAKHT